MSEKLGKYLVQDVLTRLTRNSLGSNGDKMVAHLKR